MRPATADWEHTPIVGEAALGSASPAFEPRSCDAAQRRLPQHAIALA
jgi:hypothetical protein